MTSSLSREAMDAREALPMCADFDADCDGIVCKVGCWLYDPEQGWCPYLMGDPAPPSPTGKEE